MAMKPALKALFDESASLSNNLFPILDQPTYDDSQRIRTSYLACSLSLEHWEGTRNLLAAGMLPTGLVVLRAQYEAVVRGVWVLYAATDSQIEKLSAELSADSEQSAKNLPQVADMIVGIGKSAPSQPYEALSRFKGASWKALNSYVHAGIHPLQRHKDGYPAPLMEQVTRNANALAIVSGMQVAVLTGQQQLVRTVGALQHRFKDCLPPQMDG